MDATTRHLRLLSEVAAAVTATLDLAEVLARVAGAVATALDADACFVYELQGDALVLASSVGGRVSPGSSTPRLALGEGVTGHAAMTRTPLAIERDAHLDTRFRRLEGLDETAYASILAVPVLARDRLVGALNVRTIAPRAYAESEVELLLTIAAQVGQAIEHAQLYGRAQARLAELEALERISRAIAFSADLDDALRAVVDDAASATGAEVCALAISPARGGPPVVTVRSGPDGADDDVLAGAAARAPVDEPGLLAVPLATRRGPVGALVCTRPNGAAFSRTQATLLGAVASHAASAVVGARGAMRGLLAQEIHHRVKNNLQTVASLLRLAAESDADPRRALRDSVGRVLAIAEVHDLLTASRDDDVDAADLVRRLTAMLRQTVGGTGVTTELAPLMLAPHRATALALVYCELFANAVEHGGGAVSVTLVRDGAFAALGVADRGPGPPPVATKGAGRGLTIAQALVEWDLAGALAFAAGAPGVLATVRFPVEVDSL